MYYKGNYFKINTANNLYVLSNTICYTVNSKSIQYWHKLLAHANIPDLIKLPMFVNNMRISDKFNNSICETCTTEKSTDKISKTPSERGTAPFQYIYCDLSGPLNIENFDEYNFLIALTCDYSNYVAVYFLKDKSENETTQAVKQFLADHSIFGITRRIRTDMGKEFLNWQFRNFLLDRAIKHEKTCPRSPHQNTKVERFWRTLYNAARCLMKDSKVSDFLWPYAIKFAVLI